MKPLTNLILTLTVALVTSAFLSTSAQAIIVSSTPQLLEDNTSGGNNTFDPNSFTISQPNLVLLVGLGLDSGVTPTQIQYGGDDADGIITSNRGSLAYFLNPSVGTADITATFSSGTFSVSLGYAWTLANVDLVNPIGNTAAGIDGSLSITVPNANSYVADFIYMNENGDTLSLDADSQLSILAQANQSATTMSGSLVVAAGELQGPGRCS